MAFESVHRERCNNLNIFEIKFYNNLKIKAHSLRNPGLQLLFPSYPTLHCSKESTADEGQQAEAACSPRLYTVREK